ncbi:MAG: TolC family protein, partial [Chitinivibrionales bacterium]|nr:TolC family protein [Chitinivibrionales bacterium]
REAVTLASQSLEISKEQYSMGAISDIELREAQLSLTQSRVRLESALFQYKVMRVQLEQLAGELRL